MHRAPPSVSPSDTDLIDALMTPAAFDHPVTRVDLIETHISWLLLTDEFAYKIKKPIVLDFLDFGDLGKRQFYCEEEIRLNRPWAPEIYLDVVAITLESGQLRVGGKGEAVEYAVRMRRFGQSLRLDHQLEAGKLTVQDMKELALNIANRHMDAPQVDVDQRERVLRLTREFMRDNFSALEGQVDERVLEPLRTWTEDELERHAALFASRFDGGLVRDCHGDMHLGNLVRLSGGITTFDCIEFNTDLRHIDVVADFAFLVMDLVERQRSDLAAHFLNRYLETTGDYAGVVLLNLFFVYRCLVRAKVAAIRSQEREEDSEARADLAEVQEYCDMAQRQAAAREPRLIIMHGLSGSGKTWVSGQLMASLPAIRIRSDIERKRLYGLAETASSHSPVGAGIYTEDAGRRVYHRLFELAREILRSGHNVILDAAFINHDQRREALDLADELQCAAVIVEVTAEKGRLRERLMKRAAAKSDPSEGDIAVLEHQLQTASPLSAEEREITVSCDNSVSPDIDTLVYKVRHADTDR